METTSSIVTHRSPHKGLSKETQTIKLSPSRKSLANKEPHFTSTINHSNRPSVSEPSHALTSPSPHHHPDQYLTAGRYTARASSSNSNAVRERSRVKTLSMAFLELQRTLPAVPKDTKLSKLDVLLLASAYIAQLTVTLATADIACNSHPGDVSNNAEDMHHQSGQSSSKAIPMKQYHHHQGLSGTQQGSLALSVQIIPEQFSRRSRDREIDGDKKTVPSSRKGDYCGFCPEGQGENLHVMSTLRTDGYLHPVKKWPMRARLYEGILASSSGAKAKKLAASKTSQE